VINFFLEPVFRRLGFEPVLHCPSKTDQTQPDYLLKDATGKTLTAAFVYPWDRWLDGPDFHDTDTPDENPGACVVSALDYGLAGWIMVTNGRLWRLYSRHAHARATNFYEVDLIEALNATGETDPNEAFRYWWLFFRSDAYRPLGDWPEARCWLDGILQGSREYAKRLGDRLKDRIFLTIFPHLAEGFLADRRERLGKKGRPTDEELADVFEATLTLLYRLLFLLYAESRDLLPIREAPYGAASLKAIKEEIKAKAGDTLDEADENIRRAYSPKDTGLYDRLGVLFTAMDKGDPVRNVPTYNGGLFNTSPDDSDRRDHRIARFLKDHKVPDRFLALAIDRLSRDQDEKSFGLVFIDYKSLEVRHLGSIYEGLLEFKLKVAKDDLTTQTDKNQEKYIPLSQAKTKRGKRAEVVVRKGEVYLSNDKAERKASGSYYTPDPIVEYIVAQTVGPVLVEKLEALRADFRKVRKTFDNEIQKTTAYPPQGISPKDKEAIRRFAVEKTYATHKNLVERLFDLKVLDPAMGSGHFLVEAVDFITDRLLKFLNAFPINPVNFALERTRTSILESLGEQGVTVDPAKLTDINLLKRHVLKRCIYGVDLNPMAVELAKVSLWLDAFTLGAPLSFLDHHLRCGNSLIGATFNDLEQATSGRLFRLDYEPLLRAINHVLFVNRMADATAAEVASSVSQYDQARKSLSGYQIVLHLLAARHFGVPEAVELVRHGKHIDLTNRDRFFASLDDQRERPVVDKVEALARRPDRRFFHWEIEFPEVFLGFTGADERQIKHKDRIEAGSAGFDVVVGNPPYDVLAEKELETNLEEILDYFGSEPVYEPACKGKQNLYKLFICRDVQVVRRGGRIGHIVPMPLLGDDQAVGVRKLLLSSTSLRAIEAFPQKDDAGNRVFEDAKLSTCIFITAKTTDDAEFRSRVHPGKDIETASPSLLIRRNAVKLYDPENQPIVACSQGDWDLAVRIISSGRMRRLGDYCKAYQGEVNETTDGKKGNISDSPDNALLILRGSNVCMYTLRSASQGEAIYLRKENYLKNKRPDAKAWHHKQNRAIFQRTPPQNNFRRLIACRLPAGHFCCDTISYFPENDSQLPLSFIVGLFNSKLLDWFFRLGSTNSKVNDYQVRIFPVPFFGSRKKNAELVKSFKDAANRRQWSEAFGLIEPILAEPPFSSEVIDCIVSLVEGISNIEAVRGDIARTERSALDPRAQPYQDLLDRIIFRLAGLTDAEADELEQRLARML
jgi:type I restriction-modification system DNA methylase subunit